MSTPRELHKQAMKLRIEASKLDAEAIRIKERNRIIKLLDDLLVSLNGAYPTDYGLAATLRQLIKGETNE